MTKQMWPFPNQVLSNLLCRFRAGYSTQHALFRLIEFCREKLDENYTIGMVLMDLSKAYDCLPHDLLIAKLEAYGFGIHSLRLIASYLSNRKQRVKIGSTVSDWQDIDPNPNPSSGCSVERLRAEKLTGSQKSSQTSRPTTHHSTSVASS